MVYEIPYGRGKQHFELPPGRSVTVIAPADVVPVADPLAEVRRALAETVGGITLADFAGVKSAAVAINDKTRPVPHAALLPPLLHALEGLGLPPEAITLVIATGAHPPMAEEEFGRVVPPDILARYPVVCHDCDAQETLVYRGETPQGTPVWVNRSFAEAGLRIVVGNIEPHQFQGFSGGMKSAAIGLAGRETVNRNHARMSEPGAQLGQYDGNPARADVEAIGQLMGVHFALNVVLNRHKQIVHAVAGEPLAVMQAGIPLARSICQVPVDAAFDLVIAAPGGHPKDLNVYQSQKALAHATLIAKPGGVVILVAACGEGAGSRGYERWMREVVMPTPADVIARFKAEGFRVGPHKAFQIARDAAQVQVHLLSEMPPDFARLLLFEPVATLQEAVDTALAALPDDARIAIMTQANATVPVLQNGSQAG